jgi:DNA-binding NtrC family response regulator
MDEPKTGTLHGVRVLIVEDEHLVALALADDLEDIGAIVVGPASTVEHALYLIDEHEVEAAVLDIKLQSQLVFPVADALAGRGVPFVFTTGFDTGLVPDVSCPTNMPMSRNARNRPARAW